MIKKAMMNNVPRKFPLIELHFINVLLTKVKGPRRRMKFICTDLNYSQIEELRHSASQVCK